MPQRLVDVLNDNGTVLHTFPVKVKDAEPALNDVVFQEKAAKAAGYALLVPDTDVDSLHTRIHVTRGGQLSPFGDDRGPLCETKAGLTQLVRERAYDLWQQEGCLDGQADEFWHRACHQQLRERAYHLWQQEGCPDGRADQNWYETQAFDIG